MQSFKVSVLLVVSCVAPGFLATEDVDATDSWSTGAKVIFNTYNQCKQNDATMWPCLKKRALTLLERASSLDSFTLIDGVSLERDSPDLPVDHVYLDPVSEGRSNQLDDQLLQRFASFLQSHSLRFDVPSEEAVNEGRGKNKLKKMVAPLLAIMMVKGLLGALAIGALGLLAGKALLVSKLALVLSLLVALRKLLGGGGSQHETYEIVSKHPVHHHEASASNHISSLAEPSPGYFGHRRSLYLSSPVAQSNFAQTRAYSHFAAVPTAPSVPHDTKA